jgi:NAD(P)-dependent dehydrogenase (short-subunit alcohol dehydrogenase family)
MAPKTALITGASSGIGAATALRLAHEGIEVALVARSTAALASIHKKIEHQGGIGYFFPMDITDESNRLSLFESLQSKWNQLDYLVNNAARLEIRPFESIPMREWDEQMDLNVRTVFRIAQLAFQWMKKEGGGTMVNVASISGVYGPEKYPGMGAYVTSKYAVVGLTEMIALEGKPYGIRVNAVSPGSVNTDMLRTHLPHVQPTMEPEAVANVIHFLLRDESNALWGKNIQVY